MERIVIAIAAAVFAPLAAADVVDPRKLPPVSADRWFNLSKTSNGYVAGGRLGREIWAFAVQGSELRDFPKTTSPTFSIDGVVLQVKAVTRRALPSGGGGDVLEAHRRYEQEHDRKANGAIRVTESKLCANAKVPHGEWTAHAPGAQALSRVYVTFEVGDYVLMVVAPYENEERQRGVVRVIDDVCKSFDRRKVG